ncbi:hypothetical protein SLS62_001632 [Diatrype stigma]|uniref:RRN6 K-rich C-terminal domain-containing protein n=1 Tax=Diatrype stigma TaxID=117547 RepID=A0AAN9UZN0_9PEZI
MPATTLLQIIRQYDLPQDISLVADEWDVEVERLQHADPSLLLLDLSLSGGKAPEQSGSSLGDVHTKLLDLGAGISRDHGDSTWIIASRPAVLQKMACSSQVDHPDDLLVATSSSPAPQSQPHSQRSSSVESQFTATEKSRGDEDGNPNEDEEEEPAMALLRSYTGSSGRFVPKRQQNFELLDQWRLGSDPNDYVFDLDKEKEVTPGMERKARRLARESRKRRRAETLLQLASREPSQLPSTQPAPETARFSQRTSQPVAAAAYSQQQHQQVPILHSDPITMSQPVPGAFAQRPKKRPKRKGGF